jgi:ribonuclease PH
MVSGQLKESPVTDSVAAISVGLMNGQGLLDLDYEEDSQCDTDMNVVMTGSGHFIEIQGTAEGQAFTRQEMNTLLDLAQDGIKTLVLAQQNSLSQPL